MTTLTIGDRIAALANKDVEEQIAAQKEAWIVAIVGAKLADEATLRDLLTLDVVAVPARKRGRPAAGGKGKGKGKAAVCEVADGDRCLGCKWGGGDLGKARCSTPAAGERSDQLCSGCGTSWDVVWADRKADGRVSYGTKNTNPSDVTWFGFWGVDRLPVWPGEQYCVMAKAGKTSSGSTGVSMSKSLDAAAGGKRSRGIWHKAREAWTAAAAEAPTELQADTTVVVEASPTTAAPTTAAPAPTAAPTSDGPTGVPRSFDGLTYITLTDAEEVTHVWPIGEWLTDAGYEGKVAVTLTDVDTAVGHVDEDGDIIFTDYEIGDVHETAGQPTTSD